VRVVSHVFGWVGRTDDTYGDFVTDPQWPLHDPPKMFIFSSVRSTGKSANGEM
jgi:hypothetical protein